MYFWYFALFNKRFINILTIALRFARFTYTFQSWYFLFEKAWVSGRETKGFRLWNHGFQRLKTRLSDCNLMAFSSRFAFCIFMQKVGPDFWGLCVTFFWAIAYGIVSFVVSLNKIGCTSIIKINKFVLYCLRFTLSLHYIKMTILQWHLIQK